jgi:ribonuclease T2
LVYGETMKKLLTISCCAILTFLSAALAQVPFTGEFAGGRSCPAVVSIKKNSNPGNVTIETGKVYQLFGKNKEDASHYWIEVPGAEPKKRWVAVSCGNIRQDGASQDPAAAPAQRMGDGAFYILALSWEPAFCESNAGKDKRECKNVSAAEFSAKNFSLHGLWPQPRSNVLCNVSDAERTADDNHRWEDLPEPQFSTETKKMLDHVMPGTQSLLERHEWIKHGTCFGNSAEDYFRHSVRLTHEVNASAVQALVAANVGKTVKTSDLRAAFDQAFGRGAGARVRVACERDGERQLISEIPIGLAGDVAAGAGLGELMLASNPTSGGCPAGIIDPAGRQ